MRVTKINRAVMCAVSALLVVSAAPSPARISLNWTERKSTNQVSVVEPIFFATTRKWNGKTYSDQRGKDTAHDWGVSTYTFGAGNTRPDMRLAFPKAADLGWQKVKAVKEDACNTPKKFSSMDEFLDSVQKAIEASPNGEVAVYVPGYFNSFEDGIAGGAELGSYLKCPVITYSWPTPKGKIPTPLSYHVAEGNVAWSQEAFTHFIKALVERFPGKVNIVCHSMGSRLVSGALLDLHQAGLKPKSIKEVVFSSADFDSRTFSNRIAQALPLAMRIRFYVSPKDKALKASKWLYGQYSRVGSPGDDVHLLTERTETQVIDFSKFGGGATGHGVPWSLISNMHKYNRPGGKWKLILPAWEVTPLRR